MAVEPADFKLAACERAEFVVAAAARLGVEPEAGSSVERPAFSPALVVISEEMGKDIGALPLEPIPGFLTLFAEDFVKGRFGDHPTACTAAVARLDHGESLFVVVHGYPS